jgi:hypothetical protein
MDGLRFETRRGKTFRTRPNPLWGNPLLLLKRYQIFPGVKAAEGVALTTHSYIELRLRKNKTILLLLCTYTRIAK